YERSRPNGKMIVNTIENGPYVRRMIANPGEPDLLVPVLESFHEQTNEEPTEIDIKWMDADDQAIQTILLGLPEYVLNKHFLENIASNLKFLNNLQPKWKRHVTIVRQIKNLHEGDFIQIYDFLKMNQDEYNPQPPLNQNFMQPPMTSFEDINNPTEAMNATLILFSKSFQLTTPTNNNQRTSSNPHNSQIAQSVMNVSQDRQTLNVRGNGVQNDGNQNGLVVVPGIANHNGTGNVVAKRPRRRDANYLQTQLLIPQKEEAGIQLQTEEFDFMAVTDKAPVYDTDVSVEVQLNDNYYDNEIFNMFTQEEQYTNLLEPIPEPQLVSQNDNHVNSIAPSMVQSGGTVETSSALNEETRAHQETVYRNLVDQVSQTMHMLNPKPDLFYHPNQKMALGYPNPTYLKKAQLKQQSMYNGNLLLEEHDPLAVYDSEETLELAQERVFVPQTTKSKEELVLSNVSNMVTVSKMISIPNEDLSDDTTSVAQKFLNDVKSFFVTLQRMVKQKMTLEVHNWSSSAHKEVYRIISYEIAPIINQVDARVKNFEIQFLQEAAKFVRDFKSLAKEADESLDKQKSLELKIERLLKASVSHDIMSIVQMALLMFHLISKLSANQKKHKTQVWKPKQVGSKERLACCLNMSVFDSGCSKHMTENIKLLINFVWKFLGTVCFRNDHIATILGYGDLKWGNIIYERSRPNAKMIVNSIENGPYVRRMIATPGEPDLPVLVPESFQEEPTEIDIKWIDADDQAIQTILLGLPEYVCAAINSCETAKEIWERVLQMMKENIASNLKFLNNLQPKWKRHVTIVRQIKNLHEADFTQIYDFLKMNQDENGRIQVAQNAVQNAGVQNDGNQNGLVVVPGIANQNGTGNVVAKRPRRRDADYLQTQLLIAQKEEAGIQLQTKEFDFMAAAGDLDKIE
nr:hypothetical protein [Tanacetum cinerariifolium]